VPLLAGARARLSEALRALATGGRFAQTVVRTGTTSSPCRLTPTMDAPVRRESVSRHRHLVVDDGQRNLARGAIGEALDRADVLLHREQQRHPGFVREQ